MADIPVVIPPAQPPPMDFQAEIAKQEKALRDRIRETKEAQLETRLQIKDWEMLAKEKVIVLQDWVDMKEGKETLDDTVAKLLAEQQEVHMNICSLEKALAKKMKKEKKADECSRLSMAIDHWANPPQQECQVLKMSDYEHLKHKTD